MYIAFTIGRVIFGLYWLLAAYNHIKNHKGMAGYAASKGVPAPSVAVVISTVLLLIGGLSIITGYMVFVGIIALIVFLVGVTFTMHNFWKETDPMAKMNSMINFQKNIALIGALLMLLVIA